MAQYLITDSLLNDLADAVSTKTGAAKPLTIEDMADAVDGITSRTASDLTASGATVTVPAGLYAAQATKSVATGTAGTPTASKGAVSNHSVNVTPSVTNTAGYITGGTKTGTAVSVTASELVSGTKSITANGTGIDVTNYAAVDVSVSGGGNLQTKSKTYTPTTSQQTESVTADNGYDGLSAVNVTVNAMPTMTLPSAASASYTGTEQAVIRPSANNQYINIPTGYNGAAKFYELAPTMLASKTITQNGTYVAMDDDLHGFSSVTVNVSGGSSGVAVTSATGYSSGGSDLTFSDLLGEPTSFVIFCAESTLATGGTPYKTAAVVYDGVNDKVQYITNTNNAQMTYEGPGAYHFYSNGQLVVTCMDSQFVSGQYGMYYTYGGGAGNIGTSLVQVGSGATSIQFTNLPDEPIYWSCMFTDNIGTSSGYTRAHVVASDGDYIIGREMGSASTFSNEHWTASYSNGTLTITSQSTSAGGYFHQPGYYQLTYAIAGDGQITTEPLSVTQNGTYTAPFGTAYTPVTVNVSSGGGTAQVVQQNSTRITATTYTKACGDITVSKTGTYDVYWTAYRTSTSGTWGTQLYIGGAAYGTAQTTFSNSYFQAIHLSNVSLTANQTVAVYGRSRGSNYYLYVGQLTIIEA